MCVLSAAVFLPSVRMMRWLGCMASSHVQRLTQRSPIISATKLEVGAGHGKAGRGRNWGDGTGKGGDGSWNHWRAPGS